jgi:hypothetical protein
MDSNSSTGRPRFGFTSEGGIVKPHPDNHEVLTRLLDLFAETGSASQTHRALIIQFPERAPSYKAVRDIVRREAIR